MSEFFYRDSDEVVGPISGATLKSLCQRGEISPETEIRKDDGPWKPAGQVKGLAELFTLETARVVMVNHRSPTAREVNGNSAASNGTRPPSLASPLPGEIVLLNGRPRFFRGLPFFSTKASAALLLFLAMAAIYQPSFSTLMLLAAIAVVPTLWLAFAFFCVRGMQYEVTSARTIFVSRPVERLQFNLRHDELAEVAVKQGLLQRLFGTGDLCLRNHGAPAIEHYIPNLAQPRLVADEIRKRMSA